MFLQGDLPAELSYTVVELSAVTSSDVVISPEVQYVLDQFASVFTAPTGLPPSRQYDHRIPLIPGARPVSIRPYRVTPELKSEIEHQVQEMLQELLIVTVPFLLQ